MSAKLQIYEQLNPNKISMKRKNPNLYIESMNEPVLMSTRVQSASFQNRRVHEIFEYHGIACLKEAIETLVDHQHGSFMFDISSDFSFIENLIKVKLLVILKLGAHFI